MAFMQRNYLMVLLFNVIIISVVILALFVQKSECIVNIKILNISFVNGTVDQFKIQNCACTFQERADI